ncbi:MAG: FAD-dependent oxidoreductase [Pseudomonadales bacterium]|nr:FAD-dependent oxidoreductase [Pseudomonadales bacterium]
MVTTHRKRIVIIGLGDTGILSAVRLSDEFDITAISPKPLMLSGQELGLRLCKPDVWSREYRQHFSAYQGLDNVNIIHGSVKIIDSENNSVSVRHNDGVEQRITYDVLLIASGVSNGFWRNNLEQDIDSIDKQLKIQAQNIQSARRIAIVGAGATGVSAAANIATAFADKEVHLFFSRKSILPDYHPKTQKKLKRKLQRVGVILHPEHRARIDSNSGYKSLSAGNLHWTTGQDDFNADLILWAVGQLQANNAFIPKAMLDADGFVKTDAYLRVHGHQNIFCVGDIAATDANRSSARNGGYNIVADNIRHYLNNRSTRQKAFKPVSYRWGSILGLQDNGLTVYTPKGGSFRFSHWSVTQLLFPVIVRKMIYKGVRKEASPSLRE